MVVLLLAQPCQLLYNGAHIVINPHSYTSSLITDIQTPLSPWTSPRLHFIPLECPPLYSSGSWRPSALAALCSLKLKPTLCSSRLMHVARLAPLKLLVSECLLPLSFLIDRQPQGSRRFWLPSLSVSSTWLACGSGLEAAPGLLCRLSVWRTCL